MKIAKTTSFKAFGTGKALSDEQLAKINKFALVPLTAEQVYVRKYLMCHSGIDRDNERFHEDMLEDFARTLPGKGFFVEGHPSSWSGKGGPGEGRFFDAATEEMPLEKFKETTGEELKLPEGIKNVKVLWGEAYLLKLDSNTDTLAKIDGGIYSFISIGFKAPRQEVTDKHGNYLFGEYRPKGEALEGSLVWLGAQPGASVMKCAGCEKNINGSNGLNSLNRSNRQDYRDKEIGMKEFLEKLARKLGKSFTEERAVEEIVALISEKDAKITALESLAEEGRAYRKHLVDDVLRFGVMVDEIPADEEGQKKESTFINTWPIDRIKVLRDKYEVKAREKFPDKFTFKSKDEADRNEKGKEAEKKKVKTGKKDYTSPEENELFETVGK
ncbi:MAG: hypothetical protein DWB56_06755 [Candidatus Jettenia sp.]|uniref:Uncharacterized protein n=1 Tax=Candidatus Jettenia caeni TaxID=247490 RepID=I3IN02_9BACT|nr:hypothetical protein [Candidatus Jettenia sp. AMX1]MBC6928653.1 hypothetical protein [Candidatus Jettenia sp.]GAB63097.1 hypothetical protein KSU1_C1501 [Candidatus Jettenia caeni]KAA0250631.1 MAG: hypothetical protein EDM77_03695 [Candidatus Jettenia sp. AMX1]MCE7879965.1 hypothetical protein [Candidatus Jettenia sp. AMX1]MCQ3926747.1 hypothetical protein [Candidatus Jettenia sp.]